MGLNGAAVTNHAWSQFVSRIATTACPMSELKELARRARPEDIGGGNVLRLISNNMQPAFYYKTDDVRFVLNENCDSIVTIERVYLKKRSIERSGPKEERRRRRSRQGRDKRKAGH